MHAKYAKAKKSGILKLRKALTLASLVSRCSVCDHGKSAALLFTNYKE